MSMIASCKILSKEALVKRVLNEYYNEDTELNSLYFDFDVKMTKGDILTAYADLQDTINGDVVARYENGEEQEQLIPENEADFNTVYEGNCKDFLESFNEGQDRFRRYCDEERLMFVF